MNKHTITALSVLAFTLSATSAVADEAGMDFFEKKIRPVLVEHCYKCHSTDAKKIRGGLTLDTREALRKGGDTGPALVAGEPDKSLLIQAIRYNDPFLHMPPRGKLPAEVIADLEKWVSLGAPDPRTGTIAQKTGGPGEAATWWSLQPIRRPALPEVQDQHWPRGEVDRFLLARMEAKGLRPAEEADRGTLLRRLTFDLTGLPPTPEELDTFQQDTSANAYEKVVDRLLSSPAFGERWGRHWLDVARFAESTGGGRTMLFPEAWRYRDYVIASFNNDKPYNQFIQEQIAGDLLPWTTPEQRAEQLEGTGFLVLGPTNYELQDKKVLEMDVIDEQLDTMGRAFLGLTLGCARCHDHKFDPIPTKDYYALAGILKSTQVLIHSNVSTWVERPLPVSAEKEQEIKEHEAAVASLQKQIQQLRASIKKATGGKPVQAGTVAVADLPGIVLDAPAGEQVGAWTLSRYHPSYIGAGYLHDGNTDKGAKTLSFTLKVPQEGRYEARLAYTPGTNRATNVPVTVYHAQGEKTVVVNEKKEPPVADHFVSLGTFTLSPGAPCRIVVSNKDTNGHVIVDAVQLLSEKERKVAGKVAQGADDPRSPGKDTARLKAQRAQLKKMEGELKQLQRKAPYRPKTMSVKEAETIEDCHICIRGNFHNPGPLAPRGFLSALKVEGIPPITRKESGRRQLANWLSSASNPLTARVMVNRIWHHLFGVGLVRTTDNFGSMGEKPSHPELLDYLASRFMEEGWSVKKIIRTLVLSRAYRLGTASDNATQAALDPENRLLSHMNRKRLDAEAIRDAILIIADQLERQLGGPQIKKGTTIEYGYVFDGTRRSVYTPVFRNTLPELYEVFDFADPNIVVGKRNVSTTATQALFLMNSPFVMDQAGQAAQRLLASTAADEGERIERAYRLTLGRAPTQEEKALALRFFQGKDPAKAWAKFYQVLFACLDFRYVD
jgi:hypothetical protein